MLAREREEGRDVAAVMLAVGIDLQCVRVAERTSRARGDRAPPRPFRRSGRGARGSPARVRSRRSHSARVHTPMLLPSSTRTHVPRIAHTARHVAHRGGMIEHGDHGRGPDRRHAVKMIRPFECGPASELNANASERPLGAPLKREADEVARTDRPQELDRFHSAEAERQRRSARARSGSPTGSVRRRGGSARRQSVH